MMAKGGLKDTPASVAGCALGRSINAPENLKSRAIRTREINDRQCFIDRRYRIVQDSNNSRNPEHSRKSCHWQAVRYRTRGNTLPVHAVAKLTNYHRRARRPPP